MSTQAPIEPSPLTVSRRDWLRLAGIASLAPASLLAGCSGSSDQPLTYAATIADARAAIRQAMADTNTEAVSVALVDGKRIVWAEAFGTIDKARNTPAAPETMFAIGSVSKVVAAIATLILVDRGLVQLDAPFVRYVPGFRMASPAYTQITVRMLLSHSSGLPGTDFLNSFSFEPMPRYADDMLHALATQRLKHLPGEMAVYCNDGFTLIEPLVAAVTGRSYTRFVEEEILTPLGMTHSRYALAPFAAGSYAPAVNGATTWPQEFVNLYASGGLCSTPSDMSRLAMMLIHGGQLDGRRILSAAVVAEIGRDQNAGLSFNPIPAFRWGLGWDGVAHPGLAAVGVTTWHKSGGTAFYGSEFFVAPGEGLAVMISGNSTKYRPGPLAERILLHALAERGRIAAVPAPLPVLPLPPQPGAAAELAAIAGHYASFNELWRFEIRENDTLAISEYVAGAWKQTASGLKWRTDRSFSSDAKPLLSYRILDGNGRRYLVTQSPIGLEHYRLEMPAGQKVQPGPQLTPAWQARVGKRWLAVNESAQSVGLILNGPSFFIDAVPGLPGYILADGQLVDPAGSDTLAGMFLKIPVNGGRDLNDLHIELRDGEEWVRFGSRLYRPQAAVPPASAGSSTITIGSEAYVEWRKLPANGTVTISGATDWKLYDDKFALLASGIGKGSVPLPVRGAAAYLMVYGAPHSSVGVTIA